MLYKEYSSTLIKRLMNKNKKGIDLVHVLVIETTGAHAVSKGKRNTENGIVLNVPF